LILNQYFILKFFISRLLKFSKVFANDYFSEMFLKDAIEKNKYILEIANQEQY
jgi:hypothetical protein